MKVCSSCCCRAHTPLSVPHRLSEDTAQAVLNLLLSCYPSASVIFPHADRFGALHHRRCGVSGNLEALPRHLQSRLAARGGLSSEAVACDRLLARSSWVADGDVSSVGRCWWEQVGHVSAPQPLLRTTSITPSEMTPRFTPDAVLYIDGVETTDVANIIAPTIMEAIPSLVATESVGAAAQTHGGQRREPLYCRRRPKWSRFWQEKRCALRGVDLMELSLPLYAPSVSSSLPSTTRPAVTRTSLLVSVANLSTTVATLHRQPLSHRRGPLRTAFGYSLPCLQGALPHAAVQCVRLLRVWQQQQQECMAEGDVPPCTSAFWVSAVGRILSTALAAKAAPGSYDSFGGSPLRAVAAEWLREPQLMCLTTAEAEVLLTLTRLDATPEQLARFATPGSADVLSMLLFSAVIRQAAACASSSEWNPSNFFLLPESFEGTTDSAVVATLRRCGAFAKLPPRSVLKAYLRQTRC